MTVEYFLLVICFVSARAILYIIDGKIIVRGDETFPLKLWAIFYMRNNNFATKRVNKLIISHQTIPIPNWLIQKQNNKTHSGATNPMDWKL